MTLEQLFAGRGFDVTAAMERLKKVADDCGLPFGARRESFNSRRAQELGKWAEALDKGDEFHLAVFKAYFAQGLNIGRVSILADIVQSVGLDAQEAERVLTTRRFKEAVDRDWEYSRACGVTAVPTFIADGQKAVGAQPYNALETLVKNAGAELLKRQ